VLTAGEVLRLSDEGNTLRVSGDETNTVTLAEEFVSEGTVEIDGVTFNVFTNGRARVEVQELVETEGLIVVVDPAAKA